MTNQHPIAPPPELVQQWFDDARNAWAEPQQYVAARAAQWGAAAAPRAAADHYLPQTIRDRRWIRVEDILAIAAELEQS